MFKGTCAVLKGNVAKNSNFYLTNVSTATRVSERMKKFWKYPWHLSSLMSTHCPGGIITPGLPVLWEITISSYKKYGASGQILLICEHFSLSPQEGQGLPTKGDPRCGVWDNSYLYLLHQHRNSGSRLQTQHRELCWLSEHGSPDSWGPAWGRDDLHCRASPWATWIGLWPPVHRRSCKETNWTNRLICNQTGTAPCKALQCNLNQRFKTGFNHCNWPTPILWCDLCNQHKTKTS